MIEFSRSLREETYAICTIVQCVGGKQKSLREGSSKSGEKSVVKSSSKWRGCRCFVNLASSQLSCITILSSRFSSRPSANKMFTRAMARNLPLQKRSCLHEGKHACSRLCCYVLACQLRYKASSRVFLLFSNVALTLELLSGLLGSVRLCILQLQPYTAQLL